ncbi:MAG: hypothetical protein ACI4XI_08455 [Ruminococcus sp.]
MVIQRTSNNIMNCGSKRFRIIYRIWISGKEYVFYTEINPDAGETAMIYVSELVAVCKDNYVLNTVEENKYDEIKALFENIADIKTD